MSVSGCETMSSASDLHFLGPKQMKELNPKLTLGELLRLVGDSSNDEPSPNDHVLDLHNPSPNRTVSVPFVLSFQNLTYTVNVNRNHFPLPSFLRRRPCVSDPQPLDSTLDTKTHTKVLLNEISGQAREGEILAVLGASGSGKSTLIDALAARIAKESLKGTIALNGDVLDSKLLKMISAYVMQDDLLFPMLTVEETLMFAAEFRLPRTLSKTMKRARVQALIDQLGLRNAAKTMIGDEGHRGVSGGERRRVSIGTNIIHDPILLFLDEPTSGLDSTSAYMVIKVLQRIAKSGSIVIMSIHQPSSRILKLLDRLIFLSRGQTVFSGAPTSLHGFFAEFGTPIPPNQDRTEFVLDLIRGLETGAPVSTRALVEFNKSWQLKENNHDLNNFKKGSTTPLNSLKEAISYSISKGKLVSGATSFANPIWIEMMVIAKRSILNSIRAPELFGMRLGAVILTGIILATIFWKLDDSPKGIQERIAFFAFAMSTTFYTCAEAIPVFLMQRFIFMRETAYNAYRRSSYVLSHAIMTIPSILLLSFTFSTITFWAVGLSGGFSGFFFFFLFTTAAFWAGSSFVTFLSGIIHSIMTGYTFVVSILSYFVLFSGFFITRDRMPPYWIWFHYASLVKYPYQGVLQNEFGDPNKCFVRGVQVFDGSPLKDVPDALKLKLLNSMSENLHMEITSSTCFARGNEILQQAGVTDLNKWSCFWVTIAFGFAFRILFYFSLLIGSKNKRK